VRTTAVVFPFDLFGSGGSGAGAALLGDELREVLADTRRERVPTRARAYDGQVRVREFTFETQPAYQDWRGRGRQAVRQGLRRGDFLLWLTGNHLGALPVYDELAEQGGDTLVILFDAHLDFHHFGDCTPELSLG
jgi:arginase family enzyme